MGRVLNYEENSRMSERWGSPEKGTPPSDSEQKEGLLGQLTDKEKNLLGRGMMRIINSYKSIDWGDLPVFRDEVRSGKWASDEHVLKVLRDKRIFDIICENPSYFVALYERVTGRKVHL